MFVDVYTRLSSVKDNKMFFNRRDFKMCINLTDMRRRGGSPVAG